MNPKVELRIRIANAFPALPDHPYPAMRAAGLLATLNTDARP
ncbi:hypothetical protein [Frankia sp. AiPs1]|nr:hypothetical protein [Frankia sp. AiPs1]